MRLAAAVAVIVKGLAAAAAAHTVPAVALVISGSRVSATAVVASALCSLSPLAPPYASLAMIIFEGKETCICMCVHACTQRVCMVREGDSVHLIHSQFFIPSFPFHSHSLLSLSLGLSDTRRRQRLPSSSSARRLAITTAFPLSSPLSSSPANHSDSGGDVSRLLLALSPAAAAAAVAGAIDQHFVCRCLRQHRSISPLSPFALPASALDNRRRQ